MELVYERELSLTKGVLQTSRSIKKDLLENEQDMTMLAVYLTTNKQEPF